MRPWIRGAHHITPRRPKFDFGRTPTHWIADDPITTQILNVMNPITPAPEKWFCQTVRDALPFVRDERLRSAAVAFMQQEGAHSHGHAVATRRIEELGIDVRPFTAAVEWVFERMLGRHPFGRTLEGERAKRAWLATRLAMVAAAEHLTGLMGNWVLNADGLKEAPVDPDMLALYLWHGAEEVEHREVCDAVFRHVSGNMPLRAAAALLVFPLFGALYGAGVLHFVAQDDELPRRIRLRDYVRAARQGRVPRPLYVARGLVRYFHPNHSPLDEGSTEQALACLERLRAGAAHRAGANHP